MAGLFLLGRLIFGGYFIYNGFNHFVSTTMLAQYAGAKGVPMPEIAVMASGALMLVGGALILLGLWPHVGAFCVILFLAAVTPIMHNFWAVAEPAARTADMLHFTKNLALLGGALGLLGVPRPWLFSVEQRRPVAVG